MNGCSRCAHPTHVEAASARETVQVAHWFANIHWWILCRSTLLIVAAHFLLWFPYNLASLVSYLSVDFREWAVLMNALTSTKQASQWFINAILGERNEGNSSLWQWFPCRVISTHAYFLNDLQILITIVNPMLYAIVQWPGIAFSQSPPISNTTDNVLQHSWILSIFRC